MVNGFDVPKERTSIEQSDESHVLKAIYNDKKLNTEDIQEFLNKKLLDRIDAIDMEMLLEFKKLNKDGKREAINRITELTYVPKYTE